MKSKGTVFIAMAMMTCASCMSAQSAPAFVDQVPHVISIRPFFLTTFQRFTAQQTFTTVFGGAAYPFFGGGVDLTFRKGIFVDLTASRFSRTGQRAFVFDGQVYRLGIPVTAREIPLEVSGGYRFAGWHRIRPYVGGGVGAYNYRETSEFSSPGENLDAWHAGYLVVGGGEVRVRSWLAVAVDAQWTYVPGILGKGGISQGFGEGDLGGIAPRIRVIFGR